MNFDLALVLVILVAVSGVIWLLDRLFLVPGRRRRAEAVRQQSALTDAEREARVRSALQEPVITEYARSFFPILLVILVLRAFVAEPFKIPSGSMMPTLVVGDFIVVNKFSYGLRLPVLEKKILDIGEPKRGDVVVFRYPVNPREDYIKRVIGIPGDEVRYQGNALYVNGERVVEVPLGPYTGPSEPGGRSMAGAQVYREELGDSPHRIMRLPHQQSTRNGVWRVGEGEYFVMGDSRDNSLDSRYWGVVPEENLRGRAFLIWMNWNNGIDFRRIGTLIE